MAFNFNWSPLVADTSRARDMLTTALNKSPKPAIIVDDIIVTELNLGSVPPKLEILEIGDLAEDRFRGIFKMSYSGDAFLTLKTRVQANPLNTYLAGKRTFAAPDCLAASSGLTIPLQITLSDIILSGFVILVFSKTKGVTVVFRNDPLESLKVSSTFDSIPFVRDYLQKEIEGQLRVLFVEDLPAIIHRLSLRLWSPEYREMDDKSVVNADQQKSGEEEATLIDPLASRPQEPVDAFGDAFEDLQPFSLNPPSETHISQKSVLRLAALTDSQHTLSLFTPSIRDAVYRAWAGAAERGDLTGHRNPNLTAQSLSKVQGILDANSDTSSIFSLGDVSSEDNTMSFTRPTLLSQGSSYSLASHGRTRRKGKKRVVDLRKKAERDGEDSETTGTSTSTPAPSLAASVSDELGPVEREDELQTPPISPESPKKSRRQSGLKEPPHRPLTYTSDPISVTTDVSAVDFGPVSLVSSKERSSNEVPILPAYSPPTSSRPVHPEKSKSQYSLSSTSAYTSPTRTRPSALPLLRSYSSASLCQSQYPTSSNTYLSGSFLNHAQEHTGGILEQAWMMKMASEIARKVADERAKAGSQSSNSKTSADVKKSFWVEGIGEEADGEAPPAYAQ